ncbi:lysophospholipid acyltransferase family protein [Litorivivens sp.]|uniref:lysophospholipid acyltransferase family protein n=1 Tax=Litorivivens sp. TaxID=2020868 RepID=UPI003566A109
MAKRKRPLTTPQKVARKILQAFFETCFVSVPTLRFSKPFCPPEPSVIAIYHDEMVATVALLTGQPIASIASLNHNGYAVAQVIARRAGFEMVYGSATKGGKEAFYELNDALQRGKSVIFTVDGSRGPRHEMKPGAIMLARKNRVPLYLLRCQCAGLRLPTWDRFVIPLPGAQVQVNVEAVDFGSREDRRTMKVLLTECNQRLKTLGKS